MATGSHPLIVIAGPTGSGKSALALRVAESLCGEIVNCDSIQVYRHFNIGAAKLGESERRGIPHHLIDVADPDEQFTAGEYARRGRRILDDIAARGRLPVVAGGTGFYLRALLQGLFSGPERDAGLRERLAGREVRRPGSLHRILSRLDKASAERIHANDVHKLIRALEVRLAGNRPITEFFQDGSDPLVGFRVLKLILNPPRPELYSKLDARLRWMFDNGLVEETQALLNLGFAGSLKPFESLGYLQALKLLRGELPPEQAIAEAQMQTRRYAKRQITWFRREEGSIWLNGFGTDAEVESLAFLVVDAFMRDAGLR
jgi:tRNA dimethylallyltransferase